MKGAEIRLKLLSDVSGRVTFIIFFAGLHLRARHFCMFSVSVYQIWYNNNVRKAKPLTFTLSKDRNMEFPENANTHIVTFPVISNVDPDDLRDFIIAVRENIIEMVEQQCIECDILVDEISVEPKGGE